MSGLVAFAWSVVIGLGIVGLAALLGGWWWDLEDSAGRLANPFEAGDGGVTPGGSTPQSSASEWCAGGGATGPGEGRHYEAFDFELAGTEPRWRAVMQEPFKGTTVPGSDDDQARGDGR